MHDGCDETGTTTVKPMCRHCKQRSGCYGRGLCEPCTNNKTIREQYPIRTAKRKVYPACRHCMKGPASRSKGLCYWCYETPEIRASYQTQSKFGRRGVTASRGNLRLPDTATDAFPGSEEKIAELKRRAAAGTALHHPDDLRVDFTTAGPVEVRVCRVLCSTRYGRARGESHLDANVIGARD